MNDDVNLSMGALVADQAASQPADEIHQAAGEGDPGRRAVRTATQRRAAADKRHREAGRARFTAWLPGECVKALERLAGLYGEDRARVLEAAVHLTAMHVEAGLDRIDRPSWTAAGEPVLPEGLAAIAISVEAGAVDDLVSAGKPVGVSSRAEAVRQSVQYLHRQISSGQVRFRAGGGA